jgi:uncharacterized protein
MNAISWFEIPVADMDRAVAFYESLLATQLERTVFADVPHAVFPADGVGGTLVLDPNNQPSVSGHLVYLNAGDDIDGALTRVTALGGTALTPVIDLGDQGRMALLLDTEGNRVALHAA